MKRHRHYGWPAALLIVLLLLADQVIKVWVKTHMHLGDSFYITRWFRITFIENNGMAYGMSFIYKPLLTLFRIAAISFIGCYMYKLTRRGHNTAYLFCLSLIFAGAAGNIFDCLFYGQIFTVSTPYLISELVPFGQGYAPVLQGRVVDMFYFPIIESSWPDWVPFYGGRDFVFFSPVFNFADSCISVGVVLVILFFRKEIENIGAVWSGRAENGQVPEEKPDGESPHSNSV